MTATGGRELCILVESPGDHSRGEQRHVLYLTLIRYDFSDWAVAIAVDPASRKNVASIVELPASPLGCEANREWGAIRSFRSHRRERSGGRRSTRPILTKIADLIWNATHACPV